MISVVMPVFNAERYLAQALASLQAQTHHPLEIIPVDDGSTDGSPELLRDFAARDPRIRPVFAPHGGRGRAANLGAAQARGEWIARMDADDVAASERLAVQLDWARRHRLDVCGSWAKGIGTQDRLWWFPEDPGAVRREMLFRCAILQPTVLMRAVIARENPYDETVSFEDYEYWTRLAPRYRLGSVPRVLHLYRSHDLQSHVVESAQHLRDILRFQRRYLLELFPDADESDARALNRLRAGEAFPDLASLEAAGHWLIRLSQGPDPWVSRRMAQRWMGACCRSAALGPACVRLYRSLAEAFPVPSGASCRLLKVLCTLRARPEGILARVAGLLDRSLERLNRMVSPPGKPA